MRKATWISCNWFWLLKSLALICVLGSQLSTALANATVWVATNGRDDATGTADHPLATIQAALAQAPAGHIMLAPGTYQLTSPLVLDARNAGLVLEGTGKGQSILSGAAVISAFESAKPGLWRGRANTQVSRLWLGDDPVPSARIPTVYWHYITEQTKNEWDPASKVLVDLSHRAFHPEPADMAVLSRLSPDDLSRVVVTLWHSWEISKHRIAHIDSKHNMLYLTDDAPWAIHEFSDVQRYQLDNVAEMAVAPGTWYRGSENWVYYRAAAGQQMNRTPLVGSGLAQLAAIHNTQHITLRNVQFSFSGTSLDPSSFKSNQAASSVDAAITIDDAQDVHLERVTISHTTGYAIWFRRNCQDSEIRESLMEDLGAGGVRIGETASNPVPGKETTRIVVDDNIIRKGGRVYASAAGVLIGNSGGNKVTHNEINDLYYSGISVGWKWGYGPSPAANNLIESNHVHRIGQQQLADMAGIYTLGESPGTVVRGNVIHDVTGYPGGAGAWAMYADQASSGILFEKNLAFRTTSGGFHENFGKDNVVRGNVLALGTDGQVELTKAEAHRSLTLSGNAVISDGATLFRGDWKKAIADIDKNTYFDVSGTAPTWVGLKFADWKQLGFDRNSVLADPGFVNALTGDFHLKAGSLWSWGGPSPIDNAGVYGDERWLALARQSGGNQMPSVPVPPAPAPMSIDEDFESTPIGSQPVNGVANVEGTGDGVVVSDEKAASGTHSLRLQDVQSEKFAYDPHFFYKLNHRSGTTHLEFRFYTQAGYCFINEWRDSDSPYHVGPSLTVAAGQLRVGGNTVASIPDQQWVTVKIDAPVGPTAKPEWHLAVSAPNGLSGHWTFPDGSDQWHRLDWLGFMSACRSNAKLFIDDIKIGNH